MNFFSTKMVGGEGGWGHNQFFAKLVKNPNVEKKSGEGGRGLGR